MSVCLSVLSSLLCIRGYGEVLGSCGPLLSHWTEVSWLRSVWSSWQFYYILNQLQPNMVRFLITFLSLTDSVIHSSYVLVLWNTHFESLFSAYDFWFEECPICQVLYNIYKNYDTISATFFFRCKNVNINSSVMLFFLLFC